MSIQMSWVDMIIRNMKTMKLNNEPFNLIKSGKKSIEVRLYDEKRRLLRVGDIIEFTNINTNEMLKAKIVDLLKYDKFKDLFSGFDEASFGGDSKESLLENIYKYYSKDMEDKFGVLGIRLELI